VAGRLEGVVVMPSPDDGHPPGILANVRRLLGLPAMGILVLASAVAALFIFGPAKRRLEALEAATERLGAGDLGARAPERGGDEIARVARAFNRMAGDLAAREQAIRTSDRLRRQMFADVSHELKTPLTAMRGYLETLRMKEIVLDAETRERYLQTVERETMRLETLVKDLLDLARYENFVAALDLRPFAAERLLALVMQRHEHEAGTNGITLRAEVTEAADQIVADPDRLEQALDNFVANALRHTPPGGTVTLSAAAAGDRLELTVADTGEGIPAEHLPHVFDRFYKVDSSRVSGAVGTFGSGLGLSIARAIVERHGGSIDVTSRPGDTRFTIVLPHALETA
jgi:signal transduction histidine kinase